MDEGISVVSSMEILYDSYKVDQGITEILSYVYEGHCILNSEERGNHQKVYPAYDESKLTKLVAQAVEQENASKEVDNSMEEKEIIQDVNVEENVEENVEVDVAEESAQAPVEEVSEEVDEVKELQNQLSELQEKYNLLKDEKEILANQFNEVSEKLVQLNSIVEELTPFKEQVETEKYEKALNEKKEFYSKKFNALNSVEKFETEEVQELIVKAVNENEEGKQAILQLNSMLVELVEVPVVQNQETPVIREVSSKRENLIPVSDDFESRYSM
jgi:DNA repair exonuclease SbcCD ATPase subunit